MSVFMAPSSEPGLTPIGAGDGRSRSGAFRFRIGSPADLPYCAKLLPAGFRPSPRVRRSLIALWDRILAHDAKCLSIVEDLELDYPSNIVGFGLSVFVSDRFFEDFCAGPRPQLSAFFYERMLAGEDVVLSSDELRRINSTTGLSLLVLHFGLGNQDLSDSRTAQIVAVGGASFFFFHGGYRMKAILNEVFGSQHARYMELGGFRLIRDFHAQLPADFESLPIEERPYLFQLRKEWVEPGAVHPLSQMFYAPAARLHFSASERRVLEGALLNESDAEIAQRLAMSINTVKKTWRSIHSRARRGLPSLMPRNEIAMRGGRGQEKRRHLLEYLRVHLEELRPPERIPGGSKLSPKR
jgi:hypothetical protein